MSNQHYFDVPFAFSGDVTAIPDPLQTGGSVSFTEGWNYNYQRNLSTDPAALPIDRSTMNWLFLQITTALQALQKETVPEFITAAQNGGVAIAYNPQAEVLWSASGNAPFTKFVNILGTTNSNTPSASDVLGTTTGWQVACDPIATSAQATAGTNNASIMTPLLVAQQTALRALLAGNSSQVFNVGPATSATHAPEAAQVQQNAFNYAGAATGTANALLATLTPAPTAYTDNLVVVVRVATTNTGATTLNVNGLGTKTVVGQAHAALQGNELVAGGFACFGYSTVLGVFVLLWATGGAEQVGNATQSQHAITYGQAIGRFVNVQTFNASGTYTPTPGITKAIFEVQGAGGGSAGAPATGAGGFSGSPGASSGSYAMVLLTAAQIGASQTITIGAGGTTTTGAGTGGTGGTTSVGTLISCPGGPGSSSYGPTASTVAMQAPPSNAGTPTVSAGQTIILNQGNITMGAIGSAGGGVLSSPGGASVIDKSNSGAGHGGNGTALGANSAAVSGVVGAVGKVIVWEFI